MKESIHKYFQIGTILWMSYPDRDVLEGDYIGCHPCINTSSLRIRQKDMWEKIVPALEHEPVFVTLEEPQE